MIKKIIISLIAILSISLASFADEIDSVKEFFNCFVIASNTYSKELVNYYTPNATIIRTVHKKDGTKQDVTIPFKRYIKELKKGQKLARAVNYTNRYEDIKITKCDCCYLISSTRYPRKDKVGLEAYFTVIKQDGCYKISQEKMGTTVEKFLKQK